MGNPGHRHANNANDSLSQHNFLQCRVPPCSSSEHSPGSLSHSSIPARDKGFSVCVQVGACQMLACHRSSKDRSAESKASHPFQLFRVLRSLRSSLCRNELNEIGPEAIQLLAEQHELAHGVLLNKFKLIKQHKSQRGTWQCRVQQVTSYMMFAMCSSFTLPIGVAKAHVDVVWTHFTTALDDLGAGSVQLDCCGTLLL